MTQSQVAEKLGIKPQSLSQIRSGVTHRPSTPVILGLQQFGINHAWVLTGQGEMLLPAQPGRIAERNTAYGEDWRPGDAQVGVPPPPGTAAGSGGNWTVSLTDREAELVMMYRKLGPKGMAAVLDFVRAATAVPEPSTSGTPPPAKIPMPEERDKSPADDVRP